MLFQAKRNVSDNMFFSSSFSTAGLGTAGMVGGFIAIGVQNINGAGGLYSWQWLFIIEGIPAVLFGSCSVLRFGGRFFGVG